MAYYSYYDVVDVVPCSDFSPGDRCRRARHGKGCRSGASTGAEKMEVSVLSSDRFSFPAPLPGAKPVLISENSSPDH